MTIEPNPLQLPSSGIGAIVDDVARYGHQEVETGGFLLAPRGSETIGVIARAGSIGIARRRGLFQVSEIALDALFAYADERELWVLGLYHSHQRGAWMSDCDLEHGLAAPEFVSVIVPFFKNPPAEASAWGWWRFEGDWVPIAAPTLTDSEITTIVFEEGGTHGG
jgi:proteasome lid subunit RPN8/RPN11